jgi:hypothetical protein
LRIRPHHTDADPDLAPAFHFNVANPNPTIHLNENPDPDSDPAHHQNDGNLRPLVNGSILSLYASNVGAHGLHGFYFEPLSF